MADIQGSIMAWIVGLVTVFSGVLCLLLAIPLKRRRVKPNSLYGVRFKKSMESEELWYDINEYGGKRMIFWSWIVIAAGVAIVLLDLDKDDPLMMTLALVPLVYLIAAIETYLFARKL